MRALERSSRSGRPLIVKKFGGTSVADVERIRKVARLALESQRAGNDVVVVVSAMSGETNRLLGLAHQMLSRPDARELDVIAATGEQVSTALTSMAIQSEGGQSCSFLGHQLPLRTDSAFTRARIQQVEQERIRKALARGQIAVVAGFQGVDSDDNITTLGRGGSDTTAVALAAALGADVCEIYTDVEGVYTVDPRVCASSRKLKSIPYEEMLELASLGAKVLQVRSVEIAMKYEVPVHVRSTFSEEEGTWVVSREKAFESRVLAGLACERNQARVEISGIEHHPGRVAELMELLAQMNTSVDLLRHCREDVHASLAFTLAEEELRRARPSLEQLVERMGASRVHVSAGLAKVSLVGIGIRSDPWIAARVCRSLARHGIGVSDLAVNELRISGLVQGDHADEALRILHEAFLLASAEAVEPPTAYAEGGVQ